MLSGCVGFIPPNIALNFGVISVLSTCLGGADIPQLFLISPPTLGTKKI